MTMQCTMRVQFQWRWRRRRDTICNWWHGESTLHLSISVHFFYMFTTHVLLGKASRIDLFALRHNVCSFCNVEGNVEKNLFVLILYNSLKLIFTQFIKRNMCEFWIKIWKQCNHKPIPTGWSHSSLYDATIHHRRLFAVIEHIGRCANETLNAVSWRNVPNSEQMTNFSNVRITNRVAVFFLLVSSNHRNGQWSNIWKHFAPSWHTQHNMIDIGSRWNINCPTSDSHVYYIWSQWSSVEQYSILLQERCWMKTLPAKCRPNRPLEMFTQVARPGIFQHNS